MDARASHRLYVVIMMTTAAAVLLPVLALNYVLGLRSLGGGKAVIQASEWQQATHGVTYAPPLSDNRPFKTARLFDRLAGIDTVVFGSSTVMGVTQQMFPPGAAVYNFAQSGNALMTMVAEAEFLQRRQPTLKWFVIPLDWALGFVYQPGAPGSEELVPPAADAPAVSVGVPLMQQLQDALSLPRIRNLFLILKGIAQAPSPARAFHEIFVQDAGSEYQCADGAKGRDFDTIFRGTCTGFRYDGSATFANLESVAPRRAAALIASAVVASSKYAVALAQSRGEPNPLILERIAVLARNMQSRGGGVILFMPPLIPGLERALLNAPHTRSHLQHTKDVLAQWAHAQNLVIIDAGQAERYGCLVAEFVDEHHALPQCYERIFGRYWKDAREPGKVRAGLWSGDSE
jgi:hypothetical protein